MDKLQAAGYGRYVVGHKIPTLLSLKYKNLILRLLKYLPCVYTVSVCLRSRFTGRFSWALRGFALIGTNWRGHFSSTCHIGQEHHGNVLDACSPVFQPSEAKMSECSKIYASEAYLNFPRALFLRRNFPGSPQISFPVTSTRESNPVARSN